MNHAADRAFLSSAQSPIGGFGKDPDDMPDPYHSYLALAAMALAPEQDGELKRMDARWNVSEEKRLWLKAEMARIKGQ